MKPLLYIVVRQTTDWSNESSVRAQLPDGFERLFDLWNDTFEMPYHQFRHRLKQIAADNHANVEGAVTAVLEDVPAGALIAPVDDDDWFSPDMATHVSGYRDDCHRGYRWPARFLEIPPDLDQWLGAWRRWLIPSTPLTWVCTTNNYVIERTPEGAKIVGSHVQASSWFVANESLVRVLDVPLSLQNRNIASQTSLLFRGRAPMTRSKLLRRHRQYRALYRRPPRGLPTWCRPWIGRMSELMRALHVRRN